MDPYQSDRLLDGHGYAGNLPDGHLQPYGRASRCDHGKDRYVLFSRIFSNASSMKNILIAILLFASCCPARDADGKPWKGRDVLHRMFARRRNPIDQQLKCPRQP
jgi:hypothetical protein